MTTSSPTGRHCSRPWNTFSIEVAAHYEFTAAGRGIPPKRYGTPAKGRWGSRHRSTPPNHRTLEKSLRLCLPRLQKLATAQSALSATTVCGMKQLRPCRNLWTDPLRREKFVRGQVESVEIDNLMDRILAVMVVPYPPGIPLIMPGERLTAATKSIQDYLLYARDFDRKFPGFETDIHGLRFETAPTGRRYLVDCIA